jgi:hypothetical protein
VDPLRPMCQGRSAITASLQCGRYAKFGVTTPLKPDAAGVLVCGKHLDWAINLLRGRRFIVWLIHPRDDDGGGTS